VLFNLSFQPLLQTIGKNLKHLGEFVEREEAKDRVGFTVHADADHAVFISRTTQDMKMMLSKLDEFSRLVKMEVNSKTCPRALRPIDRKKHRSCLAVNLKFNGWPIPNLTPVESWKYIGTTMSANRTIRLEAAETKLLEMRIQQQEIIDLPLSTVQKSDAIKPLLPPMSDFMLLNGDAGVKQLTKRDQHIRRAGDRALKVWGLSVECHHASWRNGGPSYPSLFDAGDALLVRSLT
jgi:hypothetical protein